jgi:hypothetical protein
MWLLPVWLFVYLVRRTRIAGVHYREVVLTNALPGVYVGQKKEVGE